MHLSCTTSLDLREGRGRDGKKVSDTLCTDEQQMYFCLENFTHSYQLYHGEVLLPPEEGFEDRSTGGEKVVEIHHNMYTRVQHGTEEG